MSTWKYSTVGRIGIHAVARKVLAYRWIFREQPCPDFGVDAHIEIVASGFATGRLIGAQIKAGQSYLKERIGSKGLVYRGSMLHLEYWLGHSLPIIVVVYDEFQDVAYWQYVCAKNVELCRTGWKMLIPFGNRLDANGRSALEQIAKTLPYGRQLAPHSSPIHTESSGVTYATFAPIGAGGRILIFENLSSFLRATEVLSKMHARPYDVVVYGAGNRIITGCAVFEALKRPIHSIHYVGDLDLPGLVIAARLRKRVAGLRLPSLQPATDLHRAMLKTARSSCYGRLDPASSRFDVAQARIFRTLHPEISKDLVSMFHAGSRISEEILTGSALLETWLH